jgi:hypothetical protein
MGMHRRKGRGRVKDRYMVSNRDADRDRDMDTDMDMDAKADTETTSVKETFFILDVRLFRYGVRLIWEYIVDTVTGPISPD